MKDEGTPDGCGAGFLEASDDQSSDSSSDDEAMTPPPHDSERVKDKHLGSDTMLNQHSRATQSRMRDLGYREGKLDLVDANEFAQVCFERGVNRGARHSAPAGRLRGAIAVLSATQTEVGFLKSNEQFRNRLNDVESDFDNLSDPTSVSQELTESCQRLFEQAGLSDLTSKKAFLTNG